MRTPKQRLFTFSVLVLFLLSMSIGCGSMKTPRKIEVVGVAYTSKVGAMIWDERKERSYFIDSLRRWPDSIEEKRLKVTGTLVIEKEGRRFGDKDSTIAISRVIGGKRLIKNANWIELNRQ